MSTTPPVNVEIKANVSGRESVVDLTTRLDDMAKVLEGDLKTQAEAAAAKLRELAKQQEAIATFERLKREAADAAAALKRAEAEAGNFTAQISQAGPPTAREAEALQRLNVAADGARTKLGEQQAVLVRATAELQTYGIASKNSQAAQQRLAAEVDQVRTSVAGLVPAYQAAAGGSAAAGQQMQRTHRAIGEGVDSISTALGRVQNAFLLLQGGGFVGGLIKDAAQTADAYNGLAARIKLATGEGAAFTAGMEGVQRVATATRSSLEGTAELFTRLSTADKTLGLTQQEALGLTQTINQAIQITGGSAEAAKAAITQLNQGLQSGVLRGDEFNSVMEQSPRLAKALADGLGVGIGQLRKMAEQGELTSETIIKALKGQTGAIEAEFGKLPATVGGALQNLSNAWTVYIGNLDKSTGASKTAAEAIGFLADHLETIVGTVATVGKGVAALMLVKLAANFRDWALGAGQATTAITANTAATVANTAAARANAVATGAAGIAAADAATKKGLLTSAMGLAAAAGRGVVGLLGGPVGLLALTATYAKDLGELAAKMVLKAQGLKTLEEAEKALADQERAAYDRAQAMIKARADQAAADKAAAEAKFGLSDAAKKLSAEFDKLIADGKSADEAINAIGKKFDLASAPGIQAAPGVLDKLAADGKLSAEQVRKAWAEALDGKDLLKFEVLARTSLQGAERSALQFGQVIDASLREAIKRAGLDMSLISSGMSQAAASALNDTETVIAGFERLKTQGIDAGRVLSTSFVKAIDTADSQKALDLLNQRIEASRKLLGDKITDGLLEQARDRAVKLREELDRLKPGISSVAEAMKTLGVTSQASLDDTATKFKSAYEVMRSSGTATAAELRAGFEAYARAAIAANNGVATDAVKVEAAMRGLTIEVDGTGRAFVKSMGEARGAVNGTTGAIEGQISALGRLRAAQAATAGNIDGSGAKSFAQGVTGGQGVTQREVDGDPYGRSAQQIGALKQQGGPVDASYVFDLLRRFQAGQVTPDELPAAAKALEVARSNARLGSPGSVSIEGRQQDQRMVSDLQRVVDSLQSQADGPGAARRAPGSAPTPAPRPAAAPPPASTSHTVNINFGTASTRINVASAADAERLQGLLQELAQAAGRAS